MSAFSIANVKAYLCVQRQDELNPVSALPTQKLIHVCKEKMTLTMHTLAFGQHLPNANLRVQGCDDACAWKGSL